MKKMPFLIIVFLAVALLLSSIAQAEGNVIVYGEYLTDSSGYNYGADFFVDSSVDVQIYVKPYIYSHENVIGDVITGILLMQPNEKHVRIGSFISKDRTKPWSVEVRAKWKEAD